MGRLIDVDDLINYLGLKIHRRNERTITRRT